MKKSRNENKLWILGSLFSMLLLPTIFITGFALGAFYEGSMSLTQVNLSSWVTALATVAIAVLTLVLAKETWALRNIQLEQIEQIRKDAIRPSIDFFIKNNASSMSFKDVYITNNGSGSAHDIVFFIEGENKKNTEIVEFLKTELLKLNILKNGIMSLGVKESRNSFVFNFHSLNSQFGSELFETKIFVNITYTDIEGTNFVSKAIFDLSEYIGMSKMGDEPLNSIASSFKKVESELKNITKGISSNRFQVNTYTANDREKENKESEEYYKEWEKKHKS